MSNCVSGNCNILLIKNNFVYTKQAKDIEVGETLLIYKENKFESVQIILTKSFHSNEKPLYRYNKSLFFSSDHYRILNIANFPFMSKLELCNDVDILLYDFIDYKYSSIEAQIIFDV